MPFYGLSKSAIVNDRETDSEAINLVHKEVCHEHDHADSCSLARLAAFYDLGNGSRRGLIQVMHCESYLCCS